MGFLNPGARFAITLMRALPPFTRGAVGGTSSMENGAGSVTAMARRSTRVEW